MPWRTICLLLCLACLLLLFIGIPLGGFNLWAGAVLFFVAAQYLARDNPPG